MRELNVERLLAQDAPAALVVEPGAGAETEARRLLALADDIYNRAGEDAADADELVELHDAGVRDATYYATDAAARASLAVVELLREVLRRLPPRGAGS